MDEMKSTPQIDDTLDKKIWRPSHYLKSNGAAKYVLGIGMVPKLYKGRVHTLAKGHKVLQAKPDHS